jgi:hypothetical protein
LQPSFVNKAWRVVVVELDKQGPMNSRAAFFVAALFA